MSERVPEGWECKKLGDVATLIMGQSPTSDTYNDNEDGVPFFQGKADFGVKYPKVRYWCTSPSKIAPMDSILFSVRAPVGAVNLNNVEACIGRGLASISGKTIDKTFLYQSLIYAKVKFEALGQGSTFEAINGNELKEFPLVCPPLPEQKKIASILTSVDEVIETTQKQIDKLQDLKKATMNELLTKGIGHTEFKDSELGRIPKSWEVKEIGKLGDIVTGSTPSTTNRDLYDGNYMFVSPADISDGMFISKTGKKLSLAGLNKTRKIPEKSVMVVCIGSTIGKVAISTQECASNQQINSIVPKENDAYFVYFAMKWMAHLIKKEAGTQAVPLINKTEFSNLFVPVPPRDEQMKIGIALHSINVGIDKLNAKLSQIQSLKKSLMQDLLTGKVRVQVN